MTARKPPQKLPIDTPAQIAALSALYGMPPVRNDQQSVACAADDDSSRDDALPWDDEENQP